MNDQENLVGQSKLGYHIDEEVGSGGFGTVYKVSKTNASGNFVYALKHITIPTERQYKDVLNSMGGDYIKADNYFEKMLNDIGNEINVLRTLSEENSSNIVMYYDNEIEVRKNPLKYDVYIRMEYLTPLTTYINQNQITVGDVIDLGLHILSALDVCHSNNVIHRDIKDDNIFVTKNKRFKLGDFGVAKMLKDSSRAASVKGTPAYIAPEVYLGREKYTNSVDLYSLGIVLYKLLNYSRIPFLPAYPADYEMKDEDKAIERRLSEEVPPPPNNAPALLGEVIVKAIMPKDDRYKTAEEFYNDLISVKQSFGSEVLSKIINEYVKVVPRVDKADSKIEGINNLTVGAGAEAYGANKILEDGSSDDNKGSAKIFETIGQKIEDSIGCSGRSTNETVPKDSFEKIEEDLIDYEVERKTVAPVQKKDFLWLLYLSPLLIAAIGIITVYTIIPMAIGRVLSFGELLAGNPDKVIETFKSPGAIVPAIKIIIMFKVIFYIWLTALITSLFFVGKHLQRKKEPDAPGALMTGKDPYLKAMDITLAMSKTTGQFKNESIKALQKKIKVLEERLKFESDFGCGNTLVTNCENKIVKDLEKLHKLIANISNFETLERDIKEVEQVLLNINHLLKSREELTRH